MRIRTKALALSFAIVVASAVGIPSEAFAADVEAQLKEMQAQLMKMQDQLDESNRKVEEQHKLIRRAEVFKAEEAAAGGIGAFLKTVQIKGTVAASYNYNFNQPPRDSGGLGSPGNGNIVNYPFTEQFQFDQFVLDVSRPTTVESPVGFRLRTMLGAQAGMVGLDDGGATADEQNHFWVHHATLDYQHDFESLGTVNFAAGIFATPIGAESVVASDNWNISQGLLWGIQPVNHTGLLVTGAVGDTGWGWLAAVGNDNFGGGVGADNNRGSSYMLGANYGADNWSTAITAAYGAEFPTNEDDKTLLIDVVTKYKFSDNFQTWLNFDYAQINSSPNASIYGIGLAQRYQVTDRFALSAREEYLYGDSGAPTSIPAVAYANAMRSRTYSLTVTGDYALTEYLSLRGELRFDDVNENDVQDDNFFGKSGMTRSNQTVGLVQAVLHF